MARPSWAFDDAFCDFCPTSGNDPQENQMTFYDIRNKKFEALFSL